MACSGKCGESEREVQATVESGQGVLWPGGDRKVASIVAEEGVSTENLVQFGQQLGVHVAETTLKMFRN